MRMCAVRENGGAAMRPLTFICIVISDNLASGGNKRTTRARATHASYGRASLASRSQRFSHSAGHEIERIAAQEGGYGQQRASLPARAGPASACACAGRYGTARHDRWARRSLAWRSAHRTAWTGCAMKTAARREARRPHRTSGARGSEGGWGWGSLRAEAARRRRQRGRGCGLGGWRRERVRSLR